ncbi:hypothetical protein QA645_17015 [Bradyrhizobium sp. CIAT3101]|uniref:hypothetical protein n=1 Tax=Bradyrhizobium sp. CIAT3101 TaxID=439387 RepID=UPI0024B12915|nr:hypothetical protein [Bradyrhizobium sp. CIAT3101]WFU84373.1 hypothetical protein QA645_17015 [Bradyrhizobium sp. CIAT3101]
MTKSIVSVGEPVLGFIEKDGKVLKAQLIGVDVVKKRTIVLYEDENTMQVAEGLTFYTQKFAAEIAAMGE